MDSPEKFYETQLPPIEKFYSSRNNENVSEEDYKNAKRIWDKFHIKNLQELPVYTKKSTYFY